MWSERGEERYRRHWRSGDLQHATEQRRYHPSQPVLYVAASLNNTRTSRERKCADTIGTVLVPWAGHFQ